MGRGLLECFIASRKSCVNYSCSRPTTSGCLANRENSVQVRIIDPSCCTEPTTYDTVSRGERELSLETSVQQQMMVRMNKLDPPSLTEFFPRHPAAELQSPVYTNRYFTRGPGNGKPTRVLVQTSLAANTAATGTKTELFGIAYLKTGLEEHMAGEHIFISSTIARLSAATIATHLGSDKLPKDFDLVSPDEMNPHTGNGKLARQARHPGWSVPPLCQSDARP